MDKDGVAQRIKAFISDEEGIITAVATNNFIRNITVNGIDFPTALYKFGRTSIAHEGELDERLQINVRPLQWLMPAQLDMVFSS